MEVGGVSGRGNPKGEGWGLPREVPVTRMTGLTLGEDIEQGGRGAVYCMLVAV